MRFLNINFLELNKETICFLNLVSKPNQKPGQDQDLACKI